MWPMKKAEDVKDVNTKRSNKYEKPRQKKMTKTFVSTWNLNKGGKALLFINTSLLSYI